MKEHLGLSIEEAKNNQKLYGYNTTNNKDNNIINILKLLNNPTIILCIVCSLVYIYLNKYIHFSVLLITTILFFLFKLYIQYKTKKIVNYINNINSINYDVLRDNKIVKVNSKEITIDDVVILNKGNKVCFDALILESTNLKVDEFLVTNNYSLVDKSVDLLNKDDEFKSNYVYDGSFVVNGRAIVKVINIGCNTMNNKKILPIKNSKNKFLIFSYIIALFSFGITFIISFNNDIISSLFCSLSISLGIIPFETKKILKTHKIFSIYKLSKNTSVITDIKTLNKIYVPSYLFVDKENMITENILKIKEIKTDIDTKDLIKHSYLASSKTSNNLIDKAIINYYNYEKIDAELIKEYPFSKDNKMMGNIYKINNQKCIYIKGSLENIFDICDLSVQEKYLYYDCKNDMEKNGLNVIAIASSKIEKIEDDILNYEVNFEGIIGLYDSPKDNIIEMLKSSKKIGIEPLIFTNDNLNISSFLASTIKIGNPENIVINKILNNTNNIMDIIGNSNIFSKISIKNKMKILDEIRNNNNRVLVCSDKIDDLSLLKKANIAVCTMNAPDIVKKTADFILLDNNIENIVNTINEINNIRLCNKKIFRNIMIIQFLIIIISIILSIIKLDVITLPIYLCLTKLLVNILAFIFSIKNNVK